MKREPAPASVKRSSASRYWTARLQVLKRPTVWGSVLLLLLPIVFLANYWHDPEGFVGSQALIQSGPSALPDDSTAANLLDGDGTTAPAVSDASTLLEVPALPDPETEAGQIDLPQPTLLESLLSTPLPELESQSRPTSRSRNPFATQPRNSESPQSRSSNGDGNVSSGLFSSFSSSPLLTSALAQPTVNSEGNAAMTSSNQAVMSLSPLQVALDRSAGVGAASSLSTSDQSEPQSNLAAQAPANAGQTTLPWLVPTGQYARPLGTPTFGTPTYIPQTSPFPGTTGYTLPSALRPTSPYSAAPIYSNYANSYFNSAYPNSYPSNPYTGFPIGTVTPSYSTYPAIPQLTPTLPISPYGRPGYSTGVPVPTFNTPATTSIPQPVPFSIPRTPPGRYIGGGEINTFSNP